MSTLADRIKIARGAKGVDVTRSVAAQLDHATGVPLMVPTNGLLKSPNKLAAVSLTRTLNLTLPALLTPLKVSAQRSKPPARPSMSQELVEALPRRWH